MGEYLSNQSTLGSEIYDRENDNISLLTPDYGFIFLENYEQYETYFRLRIENRKKDAAKFLNQCLFYRKIEIPAKSSNIEMVKEHHPSWGFAKILHDLVDVISKDERFGFITDQDIDDAVAMLKKLIDSRLTYEQAAAELGCSVHALHTRVWREGIKPDRSVYLRRSDIDRLKSCEKQRTIK